MKIFKSFFVVKTGGGRTLLPLILALFFSFQFVACVQEEVGPAVSVGKDVVLGKKGSDNLNKDLPSSDCHCKMKILQIEPIAENDYWYFKDFTDPNYLPSFIHYGYGNNYETGAELPLPYYQNLAPPDAGCHEFLFTFNPGPNSLTDPDAVTLHTEIRCYQQNPDGTETLSTTTFHDFTWGEGVGMDMPGYELTRFFWKQLSCEYLTAGEEDCTPDVPRLY